VSAIGRTIEREGVHMAKAFTKEVRALFSNGGARAGDAVEKYFSTEGKGFTGSQFELVADSDHPDEITARDVVAVSMLGVQVPERPARWLLGDGREQVRALLEKVPNDVDVWTPAADRLLAENGPLWELWDLLGEGSWPTRRAKNGLGQTKRSKLLAAKRPRLVPVIDKIVEAQLGNPPDYWQAFHEALADEPLRLEIEGATQNAPAHVSLLRRLDVVVWMTGKGFA
jgi:hypothetical protein